VNAARNAQVALEEAGRLIAIAQRAMRRIDDTEAADLADALTDRRESVAAIARRMRRIKKGKA